MALGLSIIIVFVLYLIDKHNRWRQTVKITCGLAALGIVGVGGFFGWQKYQANREEKQERAEAAAQQARLSGCVSRLEKIAVPKDAAVADIPGDIQSACDANADATQYFYVTSQPLQLPPGARLITPSKSKVQRGPQTGQYSAADIDPAGNRGITITPDSCEVATCSGWAVVTSEYGSRIERRSCFDTDLNSKINCGNIAVLKKGDRVLIVSDKVRTPDGSDIYGAKFQEWTGWVNAGDISADLSAQ